MKGTVQLLQLANSGQTATIRTTTANTSQSSQSTPTSLIFNLSQFQSGSGLLILNSPTTHQQSQRPNESAQQLTGPLTLVYGRPPATTSAGPVETASIPNVICSTNKSLNSLSSNAKSMNGSDINIESRLNQLNQLNSSINLLNSQNINVNDIQIKKEFEINGNFLNSSSDSDNSDEMSNETKICVDNSGNS